MSVLVSIKNDKNYTCLMIQTLDFVQTAVDVFENKTTSKSRASSSNS